MHGFHIRVTPEGKKPRFEMMDGDYKIRDVSPTEIIQMLQDFSSTLRWALPGALASSDTN